jgi:hypothetical protein
MKMKKKIVDKKIDSCTALITRQNSTLFHQTEKNDDIISCKIILCKMKYFFLIFTLSVNKMQLLRFIVTNTQYLRTRGAYSCNEFNNEFVGKCVLAEKNGMQSMLD